jgi:hypothetical protein
VRHPFAFFLAKGWATANAKVQNHTIRELAVPMSSVAPKFRRVGSRAAAETPHILITAIPLKKGSTRILESTFQPLVLSLIPFSAISRFHMQTAFPPLNNLCDVSNPQVWQKVNFNP